MKSIKGKKMNMTQVFLSEGKVKPVTRIGAIAAFEEDILGKQVRVVGTSKGKGFTGVMKRWGFAGGPATRGQSTTPRMPGSIGSQTPGRVLKGKKMAGRHGNKTVTLKDVRVLWLSSDKKEIFVSGPVPGARNSEVTLSYE
jgi:large subunit ribosomal protein L3